ncbi:MAG: gluconate 2-dehydrogenase subunit 3 family protein, partial [Verrucomicrobia bacterium]|nr:gluconate 2-dehydrogenase subunit 3 family protein [Verrucomicrobiota bacterium]
MSTRPNHPPRDTDTHVPMEPVAQPGYYPDYDVISQQNAWDDATRKVVLSRLQSRPSLQFFNPAEAEMMLLVCDHIIPQDDRDADHRIEIIPVIDERLHKKRTAGYRYETMPPDDEAYRLFLQALDLMSRHNHGKQFSGLSWREQELILQSINKGKPLEGAGEIWLRLPVHQIWTLFV